MAAIDRLFRTLLGRGASDLHLMQEQRPKIREHGHLVPLDEPVLTGQALEELLREAAPSARWERYRETGDADFAYALGDEARFRVNYYRQLSGHAAVFRTIPARVNTLEELEAPELFKGFTELSMGLILVTGPTGSGKSTTLAAILDHLNQSYARKVLTIEEPVEFVHPNKRSIFVQREVGQDTESFAAALRAAGREDCDVILVGELRDLETISLAMSAAEMGSLVFGTLHTNSAAKTIDRMLNVFPPDQQEQVRSMLSTSLRAVVSQQLLRTADGDGRVAAHEILVRNSPVAAAIRDGQVAKINQAIQSGKKEGMVTMDDALMRLVEAGTVTAREAYLKAFEKSRFEPLLDDEG